MSLKLYDEDDIQDIADAIRAQNGSASTYKVSEMASAISAISGGGGYDADDLADLSFPTGDIVLTGTTVGNSAFAIRTGITSVTGANVTTLGVEAFGRCSALTSVSFPEVTTATQGSNNYSIIGTFRYCTALTSVNLPKLTKVGLRMFDNCTSLTSISLPSVTSFGNGYEFYQCTKLTAINLPELTSTNINYSFYGCSKLVTAVFPKHNANIASNCFRYCSKLTTVDTASKAISTANVFTSCTLLDTLILRYTSVVTLSEATSNFSGTPFASGGSGGTIYVPSALISSYQSATNWSTLDGYGTVTWVAIEGSQYENYYADGTAV